MIPIDPNPAISAHVVFPQSGHIRPKKTAVFPKKSTFFQIRTYQNLVTAYGGPIYQIKAGEMLYSTQKYNHFCTTLNLCTYSKSWRKYRNFFENPGEIPHAGWKSVGSKHHKQTKKLTLDIDDVGGVDQFEPDATPSLCMVNPAQARHILLATLVDVHVTCCKNNTRHCKPLNLQDIVSRGDINILWLQPSFLAASFSILI